MGVGRGDRRPGLECLESLDVVVTRRNQLDDEFDDDLLLVGIQLESAHLGFQIVVGGRPAVIDLQVLRVLQRFGQPRL